MKSLHFCTPQKLAELRDNNVFYTIRTGFVPELYTGERVILNSRVTIEVDKKKQNTDTFMFIGIVQSVIPIQFKALKNDPDFAEEIARYERKFHDEHWFFKITFLKEEFK